MAIPDTTRIDLATYEGKYPTSLFNKGVRTQDEEHVGHVIKETGTRIIVDGHFDYRFVVPKEKIIAVGRNVILGMRFNDVFAYRVSRNDPLPED
ncbi:MAG: hypothetical protein QXX64_00880 [Nitrososphaera sp.]|uniref:Uncharacterized protein n=1 Tax=Nitrososphaera gargensis (strain Ga9.2) TaxID=1237085 RepID=K0ILZ2_NITGG|nr:hypothetical protein [Candidatus Nitrososphaera gargensis]AFU59817.1 hypothetical protein Ngar_c28980 [Candidatus Nitrososphaera gargensis Ga9.2]